MNLIIVNGLPATGKTTIARQLSQKLDLPLIGKDTIKEFLFDSLGTKDREWSRTLGKASNDFLYELTDKLLADGYSIIVENAFEREFAVPRFEQIMAKYSPTIVEILCTTDADVRRARFIERNECGDRHTGHVDKDNYPNQGDPEPLEKYAPLNIGTTITIDATDTHEVNFGEIVDTIKQQLEI